MKKLFLLYYLSMIQAGVAFAVTADTITLNLNLPTLPSVVEYNDEGVWTQTYSTADENKWLEFGLFRFSHMANSFGGEDVGGGMSYWDGFTLSTNSSSEDYGSAGDSGGWVAHQWGCMADGGIQTEANGSFYFDPELHCAWGSYGEPYLVAYWGYSIGWDNCCVVSFTDDQPHRVLGTYIANHPWPYYGNVHGDGFARTMDQEGDYFRLVAHGISASGEEVGTVSLTLAEYSDGELRQSTLWEWMDLTPLGEVQRIYFTMETSDEDALYGANTAVYFCLDKMQIIIERESIRPERPSGITTEAHESTIDLRWNPQDDAAEFDIRLGDSLVATIDSTHYILTDLLPATEYTITLVARSIDGLDSDAFTTTVSTTDETAPTAPQNLTAEADIYSITLAWDASEDNVAVDRYTVYVNGQAEARPHTCSYSLTGLDPDTEYFIEVDARDAAGNVSDRTAITVCTLVDPETIVEDLPISHLPFTIHDLSGRNVSGQAHLFIYDGKKIVIK